MSQNRIKTVQNIRFNREIDLYCTIINQICKDISQILEIMQNLNQQSATQFNREEMTLDQYHEMRDKEYANRVKKGTITDTDKNYVQFDKDYFMELTGAGGIYNQIIN